jgi:hypothetical protein
VATHPPLRLTSQSGPPVRTASQGPQFCQPVRSPQSNQPAASSPIETTTRLGQTCMHSTNSSVCRPLSVPPVHLCSMAPNDADVTSVVARRIVQVGAEGRWACRYGIRRCHASSIACQAFSAAHTLPPPHQPAAHTPHAWVSCSNSLPLSSS